MGQTGGRFLEIPPATSSRSPTAKAKPPLGIMMEYGRVTNKVDAANNVIFVYTYDANNRLLTRWTPAKGTATYIHDSGGNTGGDLVPRPRRCFVGWVRP